MECECRCGWNKLMKEFISPLAFGSRKRWLYFSEFEWKHRQPFIMN